MIDERCGEKMVGRPFWGCIERVNDQNLVCIMKRVAVIHHI
jgi:hypothetical protein